MEPGIPTVSRYSRLLLSDEFGDMEEFSDRFIRDSAPHIRGYGRRWVPDPFHQWGRQWEYPFVFQEIAGHLSGETGRPPAPAVLDAGSGITFFPYYCALKFTGAVITCYDRSPALKPVFARISRSMGLDVEFRRGDIRGLPFEDGAFDIIYCVSVLEHTADHPVVLNEFKRALRPGGLLIVTFDVSLDGIADITIEAAERLIDDIEGLFAGTRDPGRQRIAESIMPGKPIITTEYIQGVNPRLLPWRYPALSAIKSSLSKRRIPAKLFKNVTCFCMSVTKRV